MFQNMFDRLLAMFMAVILLVALIGGALSMTSIRSSVIEGRMESLLTQAREIAFLASRSDSSTGSTMEYLQWKAQTVYEDYEAYILIVDRSGRVMDNMQYATQGGAGVLATLDSDSVSVALLAVLSGEEIQMQMRSAHGPVFTVAVPWMQDGTVHGAVFIHTSAQIIEAEYHGVLLQIAIWSKIF